MPDADDGDWLPEFKPGWPNAYPAGLVVMRSTARPNSDADLDELDEYGQELRLVIHGARHPGSPKFGLIADLTIESEEAFAGVTVLMPLLTRDEPDEDLTHAQANELLHQYGEWAAGLLYDHAAMAMRSQLASGTFDLVVPFDTPRPEIHPYGTHVGEEDPDDSVGDDEPSEG